MGFSRQEYWSRLSFPPPVNHILSEIFTMTRPFWVTFHSIANSFPELDKSLCHEKTVVQEREDSEAQIVMQKRYKESKTFMIFLTIFVVQQSMNTYFILCCTMNTVRKILKVLFFFYLGFAVLSICNTHSLLIISLNLHSNT